MADLKELEAAFVKADESGNAEDAQAFATEIKRLRAVPSSSNATVAHNAVGKAMAALPDMFMNAPTNLANLGRAAYGVLSPAEGTLLPTGERMGAPPEPLQTPDHARRAAESVGFIKPNVVPRGIVQKGIDYGVQGAVGGMLTGGASLPRAATGAVMGAIGGEAAGATHELTGNPALATAAGFLAPAAAAKGAGGAQPKLQAQNVVRDATLKAAQDAGYVLPPSAIKPTAAGNAVESFAGKAALKQEADLKNQQVTNRLVRDELNVPAKGLHVQENAPITEGLLDNLRTQASVPYREVAALSPAAKKALEVLRDTRSEAKDQWRHWDMQGVPEAKRQAVALDQKAEMLERFLERQATSAGKPDLVPQLREARTYIAKTFDVERALNLGNGNVDAQIIGRALDRGRPLSGNLETIAKFAEGPGRNFTREGSKVPAAGVSALNWPMAAALGVEGSHYLGPSGAVLAAIPFARGGVRSGLLSDVYQQNFNRPSYGHPSLAEVAGRTSGPVTAGTLEEILRQHQKEGRP